MYGKNNFSKPIKVCHIVTTLSVGGMENGIVNLSNNINSRKFEIIICCINRSGEMANRLKNDVGLVALNEKKGVSILRFLKVAKVLKKIHPEIVHTHAWGGGSLYGIIGARIIKVPIVINGEHGAFFTSKIQKIFQKLLFFMCDYNLAVSDSLKEKTSMILSLPMNKIKVIKNGVDTNLFNGNYDKKKIISRLLESDIKINDDYMKIFNVGSLKPEKSQITLLQCAKKIKNENADAAKKIKFYFVGAGDDQQKLLDYVKQNDLGEMVFFLGIREDIHELFSVADLVVSTSIAKHEGLSNVLLEAMSSSIPAIATMSVGSKEIIEEGYNGFLIKEGDVEQLSFHIISLFNNRAELKRLGLNARKNILEHFTIDKMVEKYEKLYISA